MKKTVLIVLSTSGTSDTAINFAVESAKKNEARLVGLYVLEKGLANEVFDTFSDIGFIGDRPSTKLTEALMKEYRQRGYEEIARVKEKALEAGVEFEPMMEHGDFVEKVLHAINSKNAALAVLIRRKKRRRLLTYFSRSLADEIKSRASCEVKVFAEE